MTGTVVTLQVIAGLLWLLPAIYLTPRIIRSWHPEASRGTMLSAPVGFLAWLQVGFSIRWLAWPRSLGEMANAELTTWAALYAMSGVLAVWFFLGARQTKDG